LPFNGLLCTQAALDPLNPDPISIQIQVGKPSPAQFRFSESMPVQHYDQRLVPFGVSAVLGGLQELIHFEGCQIIASSFVGIDRVTCTV
jgi:hypothetical protein